MYWLPSFSQCIVHLLLIIEQFLQISIHSAGWTLITMNWGRHSLQLFILNRTTVFQEFANFWIAFPVITCLDESFHFVLYVTNGIVTCPIINCDSGCLCKSAVNWSSAQASFVCYFIKDKINEHNWMCWFILISCCACLFSLTKNCICS